MSLWRKAMRQLRAAKPWFTLACKASVRPSALRVVFAVITMATALVVFSLIVCDYYELGTFKRFQPRPFSCRCQPGRPLRFAEPQIFHTLSREKNRRGRPCAMAYSTFFDHRDRTVKVVTDSDLSCFRTVSVACQLWYANSSRAYVSDLIFDYHLLENEETEKADRLGAMYSCKANPNGTDLPYAVSFYSQRDVCKCYPTLSMEIHYPTANIQTFSVCVPALYGSLSAQELVGFVELHRLLGAEKFYFYNESTSAEVNRVLNGYSQLGLSEVLQWRPPFPSWQIYHDQQVMQLDCSLRNLRQSEWVAQMDVDEALLPANGLTWLQMVRTYGGRDTGAFVFLNRFFGDDESSRCPDGNHVSGDANHGWLRHWFSFPDRELPVYLRRLMYYDEAFPPGSRSKIMYRPEATAQARTHMALLRPGFDLTVLSYDQAANLHYRHSPKVRTDQTRFDRSACFYESALKENVRQTLEKMI